MRVTRFLSGPFSEVESVVAAIWAAELGHSTASLRRGVNFFELGGHSIGGTPRLPCSSCSSRGARHDCRG